MKEMTHVLGNAVDDKTLRTRMGDIPVVIPQVREMEFYPSSIEKGCRSERALKLAIAQMYGRFHQKSFKVVFTLLKYNVLSTSFL